MSQRGFTLTVRTECEMLVYVEASSPAEARRKARANDYDQPIGQWEPDYAEPYRVVGRVTEVVGPPEAEG